MCELYVHTGMEWVSEDAGAHWTPSLKTRRHPGFPLSPPHHVRVITSPVNSIQCILILFFPIPATVPPTRLLEPPNPLVPYNSETNSILLMIFAAMSISNIEL